MKNVRTSRVYVKWKRYFSKIYNFFPLSVLVLVLTEVRFFFAKKKFQCEHFMCS